MHMHMSVLFVGARGLFAGIISSFHYVSPDDETQGVRLGGKLLYPLSHSTSTSLQAIPLQKNKVVDQEI